MVQKLSSGGSTGQGLRRVSQCAYMMSWAALVCTAGSNRGLGSAFPGQGDAWRAHKPVWIGSLQMLGGQVVEQYLKP